MKTDNYIIIDCPSKENVMLAIQQLSNLYADTGFTDRIKVYQAATKEDLYLLRFTREPDFERFKYFVNYLAYPDIKNYKAKVLGYWTITDVDQLPEKYLGKRTLLYVPDQDTEGDNVLAVFPDVDQTVKLGFAIGEEYKVLGSKEFEFFEPNPEELNFEVIGEISPNEKPKEKSGRGCSLMLASFFGLVIMLFWLIN